MTAVRMASRAGAWAEMVVLFLALYAGIPWAGQQIDRLLGVPPWPFPLVWFGLSLCLLGLSGLAWCFALFGRIGGGTPNPRRPPQALITVGPYAWTRNPIAMSHAAALIGLSVFLGTVSAVVLVILLSIPVHMAMLHEERTLELRFGDAYREYRAQVPRWFPRPPRSHN
jgi:protein-S-isoprenylcysteine O-methyltransferase Ste14